MDRVTIKREDGSWAIDDRLMQSTSEGIEFVIDRLAAYEDMHEAVEEQYRCAAEKLESLKGRGSMKSASARQLIAQKISCSNTLGMIERYSRHSVEGGHR